MCGLRVVSWNIENKASAWRELIESDFDVALLQEAGPPPAELRARVVVDDQPWATGAGEMGIRPWRTAVVGLSDRVRVRHLETAPLDSALIHQIPVSRSGTLALAEISFRGSDQTYLLASMHAQHELPRAAAPLDWIYADASAHRLVSDLSSVIGSEHRHQIVVGADLNFTTGEELRETNYWRARHAGVFERMRLLGLPLIGPHQSSEPATPAAAVQRERQTPTYRHQQDEPHGASKRIDFVFASEQLRPAVEVLARNDRAAWGPSSHCKIEITLRTGGL